MHSTKLSPDLQSQLTAIATRISEHAGTVLFHAGEPGCGAFLIRSGKVKMSLEGSSELYPARFLRKGSLIGLPATFSGEPYSLTAETVQDSDLYFIPRNKLLNLLQHDPGTGYEIVRILSEEIFQMRKTAYKSHNGKHRRPAAKKTRPLHA
jgi:CRP/FNR family transcriptional regulator, dissimilatory nitrate respiration regulator